MANQVEAVTKRTIVITAQEIEAVADLLVGKCKPAALAAYLGFDAASKGGSQASLEEDLLEIFRAGWRMYNQGLA